MILEMMTITEETTIKRSSCMVRLQKPLRWLIQRAYRLVHGSTRTQHKDNLGTEESGSKLKTFSASATNISFEEEIQVVTQKEATGISDNTNSTSTTTTTGGGGGDADEDFKVIPILLDLPPQVRQSIYNFLDVQDIRSLRLTCGILKEDVNSSHGLSLKVHDGRFEYEKPLQMFGISKLSIENFVDDGLDLSSVFPRPHLLKTLIISGSISSRNLEFLLRVSCNLTELRVHFESFGQQCHTTNRFKTLVLENIKILHVSCITAEISTCPLVRKSVRDILKDILCPNLTTFQFQLVVPMNDLLHGYHLDACRFIARNKSLKNVDIQLQKLGSIATAFLTNNSREDIVLATSSEWLDTGSRIRALKLNINSSMHLWYPLLDFQTCLRSLTLQISGQSWNRLILILDRNARTLTSLTILGLCSTSQDGITAIPVDFGLLRNLKVLENLEIQNINMESRGGVDYPCVLRTSSLPQSLLSVKLCYLRLQSHQSMFLLVKLPMLESLDLQCWSDSEGTLAGYLSVVTFLIKFDVTSVKSLILTDSRRRLENQQHAVNKMINALFNEANITQANTELYSKLHITRYVS